MTRRQNVSMPSSSFGLLLVEGGDEMAVCKVLAGAAWTGLCCWKAEGRDLANLSRLAKRDPNLGAARSIGIVLDVEDDLVTAQQIATEALGVLGTASFAHGVLTGTPRVGAFLSPDGTAVGSLETLCRQAVRDSALATCVDQLVTCAGIPHGAGNNARAREDKGWLRAYLGMTSAPELRFYRRSIIHRG
jgi:hypothetical protein